MTVVIVSMMERDAIQAGWPSKRPKAARHSRYSAYVPKPDCVSGHSDLRRSLRSLPDL